MFSLLKSGIVVFGRVGRFRVGKLRVGRLSGGREELSPTLPPSPVVDVKVLVGVIDGRLRDGNDSGGRVGTDKGGSPVAVGTAWLRPGFARPRVGTALPREGTAGVTAGMVGRVI
jgi:hypothetical protein